MQKNPKQVQQPKKKSGKDVKKQTSSNWIYFVAFISAFILYGNTIQHEFTLDDDLYFVKHSSVQKGVKGIGEIFSEGSMKGFEGNTTEPTYRPVTLLTFAVEKQIWGNNPHPAHFINVLIYALLGLVLVRWLRNLFPLANPWLHLMILLLFLAHPVHTEVVASVKSRDELLAGLFGFMALTLGMKLDPRKLFTTRAVVTFLVFLMAIMSKESAITLTLMFPLTLFILRKDTVKDIAIKSIPFFSAAMVFLLIRQIVVPVAVGESKILIINNVLYGINDFWTATATKLEILLVYLRLLIFPHPLSWDYSFNQVPIVGWDSPLVWFSLAMQLGLIILAILTLKKNPIVSFCIVFYFITFSLTNNIFYSVRATVAERFLLIPSMGFIIAMVFTAVSLLKINLESFTGKNRTGLLYGFYAIMVVYSVLTIVRNPDWKNNFSLFQSGVKSAPNSARVLGGIGFEYMLRAEQASFPADKAENYKICVDYLKQSLDILPSYNSSSYNLAVALYEMGDTAGSLAMYRQTLLYSPKYHNALQNAGLIYMTINKVDSGIYYLEKLKSEYPGDLSGAANLAVAYYRKKDYDSAIKNVDDAIRFDPHTPNNYNTKAIILHEMGNEEEAQKYLKLYHDYSPGK